MVAVAVADTTADGSAPVFLMVPGVVVVDEMVMALSSPLVAMDNLLEDTPRRSWKAMRTNFIVLYCWGMVWTTHVNLLCPFRMLQTAVVKAHRIANDQRSLI